MPPKRPVAYEEALPYPSSCLMAVILYFRLHYCKSLCKFRKKCQFSQQKRVDILHILAVLILSNTKYMYIYCFFE